MDDRRHVVNAGVRHGRDAEIASQRAVADVGVTHFTSTVIAIRGRRLALGCYSVFDGWSGSKVLCVSEINAENQIVARVAFDSDEVDAAFEELDARYLAGEAADHAHTWSVIADSYAAFNRHELPAEDLVTVDRRRATPFESSTMTETLRSIWDLTPDLDIRIEAVHRLSSFGAVVTHVQHGTSTEGFDAEWRSIELLTVDGDRVNYCEIFDEADLDAALARFDELNRPALLDNAATQVDQRFWTHFAARDWDAMAELLADDISTEDRRRVVNAGVRHGRDSHIAEMRAVVEVGVENITSTIVATRGSRLALTRICGSNREIGAGELSAEVLNIVEINADNQILSRIGFDIDDIDAAFEELDARYLAGEATPYANTWTAVAGAYVAFNRHEIPATPDWVNVDHRRATTVAPGDMAANIRATWDVAPNISRSIEAVHRLDNLGAVVTHTAYGTSREGFDAEWRLVALLTFTGDLISRCELFDETDLDAALARFDELHTRAPRLENAASQVHTRLRACCAARNWEAMAELLADDIAIDDRRRAVNSGIQYGRDAAIADMRGAIDLGLTNISLTVIATRGVRLELCRTCIWGQDRPDAFRIEFLSVVEINADERIVARVAFDLDDIDAAFEELEARYLAGEAAAHSHAWSVIARIYAAFNRHEFPSTTPDSVYIDHRPLVTVEAGDLTANIRATWDLTPDVSSHIEAVHRLSELGAVVTQTLKGTSKEGLDVEWRTIDVFTVEGDLLSRCEVFDEAELDAALARFDELHPQRPRLENEASRVSANYLAHGVARDWDAITEILADDYYTDDRRHVVGGGIHGRDAEIANYRAGADLGITNVVTSYAIATRGERLVLTRARYSRSHEEPEAFFVEILAVVEINADNRLAAAVVFDVDDINAAFEELDARYLAGEAAAHAHTWSVNSGLYAGFNRHELPATTPDWTYIDHRPLVTIEANDLPASMRAIWDLAPDISIYMEAVHRLSDLGAVVTAAAYGSSQEGFDAEWRMIDLFTVEGDLISRCEIFDETDLDAALARFDEIDRQASSVEQVSAPDNEGPPGFYA